ncbi:MAG: GT4 family glycosyltransferase PelF [Lachnospiraceae bacterium]|nr:GT4 family glycosyltransferase PelF [Lachnospiraceae bacterium]
MKVCLVVEGAYPYVNGGVANWVQQLILSMPEVEFSVQIISSNREEKKEIKYKVPDNVTEMREVYLLDQDIVKRNKRNRVKLNAREYEAFRSLMFGDQVDWSIIFDYFHNHQVSTNDLLASEDFLNMTAEYYKSNFERVIFNDFLWTMRSMYLPLFTVLKGELPQADIYNSVSTGYAGILACYAHHVYNKPVVISEHGIYTREREEEIIKSKWVEGLYKDLWISQFKKISTCCYDSADRVVSLFKDARDFQIELGCPKEKTMIVPNGVDASRFEGIPQKDPDDKFINVGAVLRVTPIKDVKTLISGFALAKQNNPKLKLWIMGGMDESPEYAQECRELVDELGTTDVVFTGMVNIKDYIGKMDFLVLSSISEGQPLSILEGFSAKKPYIATNVGNCAGMIRGEADDFGSAGFVVPVMNVGKMAEAMSKMSKDENLRKTMGEAGYKRAVANSAKDAYRKYFDMYQEIYV